MSDDYLDEYDDLEAGESYGFWSDSTNVIIGAGADLLALPCLTCGFCGSGANLSDDGKQAETADDEDEPGPKALCKEAIKERLKAPSTVDIPCRPMSGGVTDENTVEVEFEFSAKKSMNVRLQKRARCLVTFAGDEPAEFDLTFR